LAEIFTGAWQQKVAHMINLALPVRLILKNSKKIRKIIKKFSFYPVRFSVYLFDFL
jgi:hypothetical protein